MADHASPPTRRLLFESLGISVVDFRCHAGVEKLGIEEPNPTHSIVFVRRGVFGRSHEDGTLVADPNHVLFFNAAQPYRYSHPSREATTVRSWPWRQPARWNSSLAMRRGMHVRKGPSGTAMDSARGTPLSCTGSCSGWSTGRLCGWRWRTSSPSWPMRRSVAPTGRPESLS